MTGVNPPQSSRDLLVAVLDRLVPPAGGFPGAGAIAVEYVARVIVQSGDAASLLSTALDEIERRASAHGAGIFAGLSEAERDEVLRSVEGAAPEAFEVLV